MRARLPIPATKSSLQKTDALALPRTRQNPAPRAAALNLSAKNLHESASPPESRGTVVDRTSKNADVHQPSACDWTYCRPSLHRYDRLDHTCLGSGVRFERFNETGKAGSVGYPGTRIYLA